MESDFALTQRPLRPDDAARLGAYFDDLSPLSRSRYGPHPFDQATADAICAGIASDDILRLLGTIVGDDGQERIVAYFLLKRGVWEGDAKRYEALGIPLDPATDITLAPSVADAYQDRGIGSRMASYALETARGMGYRRVVLWGGVQAGNERAVHFYAKCGFRKVGEFFTDKNNFDMILDLSVGTGSV